MTSPDEKSSIYAKVVCQCREVGKLTGEPCNTPEDLGCLLSGITARVGMDAGWATEIPTKEEAIEYAKKCEKKEARLRSPGAKLMFSQIRMDSAKHAHVLAGLINIVRSDDPEYTWDYRIDKFVGKLSVEKALGEHIEM